MVEYIAAAAGFAIARYIYKKNEAKIKGWRGEVKLARKLKKMDIPGNKKVMRDSLFPAEWGSSQVDAIAVTRYGIIVCEMKNYDAKIYGDVKDGKWEVLYGHIDKNNEWVPDERKTLPNPVRQNNTHVSALRSILSKDFPNIPYYPLSVFSNKAKLYVQNSRNKVCKLNDVNKVVNRLLGPEILSDVQVDQIAAILDQNMLKSRKDKHAHVARVELNKDLTDDLSPEEISAFRKSIIEGSKYQPIISTADPYNFGFNTGRNKPITSSQRPLYEILQEAESRRSSEPEAPSKNQTGLDQFFSR